jgi:hypothetical protein
MEPNCIVNGLANIGVGMLVITLIACIAVPAYLFISTIGQPVVESAEKPNQ